MKGSAVEESREKPAPADWKLWSEMPKAELWEAVVLSMDASPADREPIFNWLFSSTTGQRPDDSEFLSECRRRMRIAQASASFSGPIKPIYLAEGREDDPRNPISLPEFGSWAEGLGWNLPPSFPRTSAKGSLLQAKTKKDSDESSLTRERSTLLKLVIGMAVKGYGFDPKAAKSAAPKEIAADLAGLGIDISDDTVRKYLKQAANSFLPDKPHGS